MARVCGECDGAGGVNQGGGCPQRLAPLEHGHPWRVEWEEMLRRIAQTVLWQYPSDVSVEMLHRHYRRARVVVRTWIVWFLFMMTALIEFLPAPRGWWQDIYAFIVALAAALALLLALPGIVCVFWAGEIEKVLKARGLPLPTRRSLDEEMPVFAMKGCFLFAVIIVVANLLR